MGVSGQKNILSGVLVFVLAIALVLSLSAPVYATNHEDETIGQDDHIVVWQGQVLKYTGADAGETVTLRIDGGDNDGDFIREYQADSNGDVFVETGSDQLEGDYALHHDTNGDDSPEEAATFEVYIHTVSVSTDMDSVNNSDTGNNTVEFTLESNRASYSVYVSETSQNLSVNELDTVFSVGSITTDSEGDDVYEIPVNTSDGSRTFEGNFADMSSGTYTFEFNSTDSTGSASTSLTVEESEGLVVEFNESVYREYEGNDAMISISTQETGEFTVTLGDPETDGYTQSATVEVEGSGGEVWLAFDTYAAGGDPAQPFSIHEDSPSNANIVSQDNDTNLSNKLDTGDYDITVFSAGEEQAVASFLIEERSTQGSSMYIAPRTENLSSLSRINESENLIEHDVVAEDDQFVFEVQANGLYAYIDDSVTAGDLNEGSAFADEHGVYVTIEETNPGLNQEPHTLDNSSATLVTDPDNNTFYLVFDESDYSELDPEDEYDATFHITEDNPYVEDETDELDEETASSSITITEREADFNSMNDNDVVEVPLDSEAVITASTTVAPGTEVSVLAKAPQPNAFTKFVDAVVTEDQMIEAEFDMSDADFDQEFTIEVRNLTEELDAIIIQSEPEEYSLEMTVEDEQTGDPITADITIGEETITTTNGTGSVQLEAGTYQLSGTAEGYNDVTETVQIDENDENSVSIQMTEEAIRYDLSVSVETEEGEPIEGATVQAGGQSLSTDSSGAVTFTLDEGSYVIDVSADGYDEGSRSISLTENTDTTVTLAETGPPTHEVIITATSDTEEPIEGATVEVNGVTETTDVSGRASFDLEEGSHTVMITAEGHEDQQETISVDSEEEVEVTVTESTNETGEGGEEDPSPEEEDEDNGSGIGLGNVAIIVIAILASAAILYFG